MVRTTARKGPELIFGRAYRGEVATGQCRRWLIVSIWLAPGQQIRNTSDSGCKLSRNEPPLNTTSGPHALQQSIPLFDHLVGGGEQRRRHIDAERLGVFEIDDEIEVGRLHDRQGWERDHYR